MIRAFFLFFLFLVNYTIAVWSPGFVIFTTTFWKLQKSHLGYFILLLAHLSICYPTVCSVLPCVSLTYNVIAIVSFYPRFIRVFSVFYGSIMHVKNKLMSHYRISFDEETDEIWCKIWESEREWQSLVWLYNCLLTVIIYPLMLTMFIS